MPAVAPEDGGAIMWTLVHNCHATFAVSRALGPLPVGDADWQMRDRCLGGQRRSHALPRSPGRVGPGARAVLSHGWGQSIGAERATSVPSTVRKSAGEVDHRDDSGPGWVVLQRDR